MSPRNIPCRVVCKTVTVPSVFRDGFIPWDDLRKILCGCQRIAKVPNAVEILPKISTAWVGQTSVTDDRRQTDRQTDGWQQIANSSRSLKIGHTTLKKVENGVVEGYFGALEVNGYSVIRYNAYKFLLGPMSFSCTFLRSNEILVENSDFNLTSPVLIWLPYSNFTNIYSAGKPVQYRLLYGVARPMLASPYSCFSKTPTCDRQRRTHRAKAHTAQA